MPTPDPPARSAARRLANVPSAWLLARRSGHPWTTARGGRTLLFLHLPSPTGRRVPSWHGTGAPPIRPDLTTRSGERDATGPGGPRGLARTIRRATIPSSQPISPGADRPPTKTAASPPQRPSAPGKPASTDRARTPRERGGGPFVVFPGFRDRRLHENYPDDRRDVRHAGRQPVRLRRIRRRTARQASLGQGDPRRPADGRRHGSSSAGRPQRRQPASGTIENGVYAIGSDAGPTPGEYMSAITVPEARSNLSAAEAMERGAVPAEESPRQAHHPGQVQRPERVEGHRQRGRREHLRASRSPAPERNPNPPVHPARNLSLLEYAFPCDPIASTAASR